ncbi:MAG: GNAT family N-acetyltransferase [Bacteroidales bacterium]|nr:GNAT family N-acetyltransferase [Bacteroidales bacterium]MBN2764110.1 GNAT family N-acetyltransferase [Bacteroidales bacterium]
MNEKLIPDIIESNLFSLYKAFADAGDYNVIKHASYTRIETGKSAFPRNIFQIDTGMDDDALSELTRLIKDGEASPFLIFRDDNAPVVFAERLKENNFRQVMKWPGMAIPLYDDLKIMAVDDKNIAIRKIEDKREIDTWTGMVEKVLFNGKRLDRQALQTLAYSQGGALYTGFLNGMAAGTLLSWSAGQVTGFYMITTLPEFRKKGIARQMMQTALRDASSAGCRYAVLESTQMGLSLYQRAGFKEYCSFSIYWMLGKDQ